MAVEQITLWKDEDGYHLVKGGDATREYVYPKHQAKSFYLDVVKTAVEGGEAESEA